MTAPCVVCGTGCGAFPAWPAVLTVVGRFCVPCYQAGREPATAAPADLRAYRTGARALGFRTAPAAMAGEGG